MKGVVLRFAPRVQFVDISHLVAPQNVPEAASSCSRMVVSCAGLTSFCHHSFHHEKLVRRGQRNETKSVNFETRENPKQEQCPKNAVRTHSPLHAVLGGTHFVDFFSAP